MSPLLRAGGGPARLLVDAAARQAHSGSRTVIPCKAARRLTELGYARHDVVTYRFTVTPAGLKAARIIRDGS